jgi:proteasome lid subunit RPN8/RPN11
MLIERNGNGRRPVDVTRVIHEICAHAARGYEEPYKREVIGILLGRVRRDPHATVVVERAIPYRTWYRTRTMVDPHPEALRRRAFALAATHGRRYLGCYHSHCEEAGSRSWAMSPEDWEIFLDDRSALVEVVVGVDYAGARLRGAADLRRPNRDGSLTRFCEGYWFRMSAQPREGRGEVIA